MQNNNNLYELRTSRHLTQKEFAEKVELNVGVYSRYERGENDLPLSVAKRIAMAFGISIDYIAGYSKNEQGIYCDLDMEVIKDTVINPFITTGDEKEGAKEAVRRLENQINMAYKDLQTLKKQFNIE